MNLKSFLYGVLVTLTLGTGIATAASVIGGQNIILASSSGLEASGRQLKVKLDTGSNLTLSTGGLAVDSAAQLGLVQMGWRPVYEEEIFGAAQTTHALGFLVPVAYHDAVVAYTNGVRRSKVTSPANASEYSVTNSEGVTTVTFGAAPGVNLMMFDYVK